MFQNEQIRVDSLIELDEVNKKREGLQKVINKLSEVLSQIYGQQISSFFQSFDDSTLIEQKMNELKDYLETSENKFFSELKRKNYFTLSNKNLINLDENSIDNLKQDFSCLKNEEDEKMHENEKLENFRQISFFKSEKDEILQLKEKIILLESENLESEERYLAKIEKFEEELADLKQQNMILSEENAKIISDDTQLTIQSEKIRIFKEKLEEMHNKNIEMNAQIEPLLTELDQKNIKILDLEDRLKKGPGLQKKDSYLNKSRTIKILEERFGNTDRSLNRSVDRTIETSNVSKLDGHFRNFSRKNSNANFENEQLKQKIIKLEKNQQKNEELQESFNDLKAENSMLRKKMDGMKNSQISLHENKSEIQHQIQETSTKFKDEKHSLEQRLMTSEKQNDQLSKMISGLQLTLNKLQLENANLGSKFSKNKSRNSSFEDSGNQLNQETEIQKKLISQLHTIIESKNAEVKSLQSEIEKMERYISSLL